MRRLLLWLGLAMVAGACKIDNDMMLPDDVAGFETFEIEGQISSSINTSMLTVTVTMPEETDDFSSLTISKVKYSSATKGIQSLLAAGDKVNLTDTLTIRLQAFRTYEWKIIAVKGQAPSPEPQLYNMSIDDWYKEGDLWRVYGRNVSDSEKSIWATPNIKIGVTVSVTTPDSTFVAVPGQGKKAAKLESKNVLIQFATGTLFTGEFIKTNGTSGAEIAWGIPFSARPKSLHGYYCYQPVKIDIAKNDEYKHLLGSMDTGQIQIFLADWDKNKWDGYPEGAIDEKGRFHVINDKKQFIDFDNDPAIIGRGNFEFSEWMDNYREFNIDIEYFNDRTPSVIVIVAAASRYGDYFTGGNGTALYLDEMSLKY